MRVTSVTLDTHKYVLGTRVHAYVYNLQQDVYKVDIRGVEQLGTRPKGTTLDI